MNNQSFSRRSPIHIGVLEGVPKRLIQLLIHDVQKESYCKVIVRQGEGDLIFRELLAHRVDLVLSDYQPSVGVADHFHTKFLGKNPVSIYGVKKFSLLKKNFPQSVKGQPFILPTFHTKLRHDVDHYFRINKITVDAVIETPDTSVQKILALEGMALIPLPDCAAHSLVQEGQLKKIGNLPEVFQDFFLIHSPRKIHNPTVLHLAENFKITF